jgi:hypothetical protein
VQWQPCGYGQGRMIECVAEMRSTRHSRRAESRKWSTLSNMKIGESQHAMLAALRVKRQNNPWTDVVCSPLQLQRCRF